MLNLRIYPSLLSMLVILSACAATPASSQQSLAAYQYRHDSFDFKVAWKITSTPRGVDLDGIMYNVRFAQVDGIEVTVALLNPRREERSEASVFPLPRPLRLNEYCDFSLLLKNVSLAPGDLLRFQIQYRATEGDRGSFRWITTFTVNALTGEAIIAPEERNTGF